MKKLVQLTKSQLKQLTGGSNSGAGSEPRNSQIMRPEMTAYKPVKPK